MLRCLFIHINEKNKIFPELFCKRMQEAGVQVIRLSLEEKPASQLRCKMIQHVWLKGECMILTDQEQLDDTGVVTIGYCEKEEEIGKYSSFPYVLMGLEDISAEYVINLHRRLSGKPVTIIETERLRIRESTEEDVEMFREFQKEDPGMRDIPMLTEDSFAGMQAYRTYQYGFFGYGIWTIELKESRMVIGRAGIENQEIEGEQITELGYMLGKHYRGSGYATEACQAILDYARQDLDICVFTALVRRNNKKSIRVLRRLEFQFTGIVIRKGRTYLLYETEFL